MLVKPDLKDELIIECLCDLYGVHAEELAFLPLGADFNTIVYRIKTRAGVEYFLKLRRNEFNQASVLIPHYLVSVGFTQVIAPILTIRGHWWGAMDVFIVVLYPYVHGHNGIEVNLSDEQWLEFGATVQKLHTTHLPEVVAAGVQRESFSLPWLEIVKAFMVKIENRSFNESVAQQTALFLSLKCEVIAHLIACVERLVFLLQSQQLEYVLCHADLHGWNLLNDQQDKLYIVDWDTVIFAPKERDLMFIGAGIWPSGKMPQQEEDLFYQGYGSTVINHDMIAYYRCARIIQDIGEFCEHIFYSDEDSEDRRRSLEYLRSLFLSGGPVEVACAADKKMVR